MNCKVCKKDRTKNPIVRNGVTRYIDENGQVWNGKQCGDCYRTYNKLRMKKTRAQK